LNGLPITIDLSPLLGKELVQVCIGAFQFILNFDADVRIAVEGTCVYCSPKDVPIEIDNYREQASLLCSLVGTQISSAERDSNGGLDLHFANGATLQILNSSHEYESFQVHVGQQFYVA